MSKFDDIKIPENIKLETNKTIQKGKLIKRKHKFKYVKIASIFIFSVAICVGTLSYSSANSTLFVNDLFEKLDFVINHPKNYSTYSENMGLSKTINGVTFTIDDVVYDGHQINLTYTIKSQNKLLHQNSGFYKDKLFTDEILTVRNATVVKGNTFGSEYADEYTYTFMQSYNINYKGRKAPKELKVDFVLSNIFTYSDSGNIEKSVNETFNFKFKFKPNVPATVIDVNETKDGLTIKSLEITPYSTSVNVEFPESLISNTNGKKPSITLSSKYIGSLPSKVYDELLDENTYRVKRGVVYDSVVNDNVYGIGNPNSNDYVIVKFSDFNNQSTSDVTEFKIKIK